MPLTHDTYHRNVLLGASRRRLEDAEVLLDKERWIGAMYLGGYAIECALASLICYNEGTTNYKDTRAGKSVQGSKVHNLGAMLNFAGSGVKNAIEIDRTGRLKSAWVIVSREWRYGQLRYYGKVGDERTAEMFISSVKTIHTFLLRQQGE